MENKLEPRPQEVKALDNFLLYIKFKNGEEKIYDMKENFKYKFYEKLKDKNNFKNVYIAGINVQWKTKEDIAPENLYYNSIPIDEFKGEIKELKD